jgi:hypothetical protein
MAGKYGNYTFTITIGAYGNGPDDAFNSAVQMLCEDPGATPEDYEFEEDEESDEDDEETEDGEDDHD